MTVTVQPPSGPGSGPAGSQSGPTGPRAPPGARGPGPAPPGGARGARRVFSPAPAPARVGVLMVGLLLASLAFGAGGAWTVIGHASAASDVVSTSEPQPGG